MEELISIIIPVYNAEAYIENCITSMLNQTYDNFELILINDGSKDNSLSMCLKYAKQDDRIKVYDKPNGNVLYTYTKGSVISVIIKKQENGWTQIASEAPIKNGAIDVKGTYNNDSVYIEGD